MRFSKIVRDKHGFTLVELVVTLAIFAILLAVAGNYLFFGNRMFTETEKKNSEKSIGDTVFSFMREKIIYATGVEVINPSETEAVPKYEKIFVIDEISDKESGYLCFGPKEEKPHPNIYGESFYRNNGVSYTVKVKNDSLELYLNVQVYNQNGEMVYETGATIKNLNIALNGGNSIVITGAEADKEEYEYVNPIISLSEKQVESDDAYTIPANTLYQQMKACLDDYDKLMNGTISQDDYKGKYDIGWKGFSNDKFLTYIHKKYYNNNWPKFPDEVVKQLGKNPPLYMKVFINDKKDQPGYRDITVVGSTSGSTTNPWNQLLFYKNWDEKGNINDNGKWYYYKSKVEKMNAAITHQYVDEQIKAGNLVEFIPE